MLTTLWIRSPLTAAAAFLLLSCVIFAGCDPAPNPKEFGEVITELPQIEGAEKPYPLPQLEDPQKTDEQDQK
ncbi:MAG: hypothetical protein HY288_05610 [Planctomycetia bacterium]|nr:hypothetical protein [Planctomycetia bacterium]